MKHRLFSCFAGIVLLTVVLSATFQATSSQASTVPQKATSQATTEDEALAHKLVIQHQLLSPQERLQRLKPSKHSGVFPEGELESRETESPGEQAHRRIREESHKGFYQQPV